MEDIIKAVVSQTGLSNEIARQAVLVVLNQIKAQLPKPIADQVDAMLGGILSGGTAAGQGTGGAGADVVGSVLKGLGGMLGGGK